MALKCEKSINPVSINYDFYYHPDQNVRHDKTTDGKGGWCKTSATVIDHNDPEVIMFYAERQRTFKEQINYLRWLLRQTIKLEKLHNEITE